MSTSAVLPAALLTDPTPAADHGAGCSTTFARVARLAAASTAAPVALVTTARGGRLTVAASAGAPAWLEPGTTLDSDAVLRPGAPDATGPVVVGDVDGATAAIVGPAGATLEVRAYLGAPFRGPDGEVAGGVWVIDSGPRGWSRADVLHVTDLARLVEDALRGTGDPGGRARADHARCLAVLEQSAQLVAVLDAGGRLTYATPATAAELGYPAEALTGDGLLRLLHPEDATDVAAALAGLAGAPGTRCGRRVRVRHADGGWRTLDVTAASLVGERVAGAIVVGARDVTAESALQDRLREAQSLEAVGRLAHGVAHDFNNLLTVVGTSARFVREVVAEALPPAAVAEAHADLDEIDHAVQSAGTLTRQLLAVGRRHESPARPTRVASAVRGVEQMAARVVGGDVEVVALLDPAAGTVLADAGQLEQVLLNLVVNARDAMPDGGVLLLEARPAAPDEPARAGLPPGGWAVVEVTDTGVGIDESTRGRLFEPFFTTKPVGAGSGLGLATVYRIVSRAGGHVRVQSVPGRGTTFTIYLPRVGDDDGVRATPAHGCDAVPAAPTAAPRARPGETVLVVEDEAAVRYAARRVLERQGYRVLEARHGVEGLRTWAAYGGAAGAVHLVLTDQSMPEMGGHELVPRLYARRPQQAVLVMTGLASEGARRWAEGHRLPMVSKPFGAAELAARVRAVLDAAAAPSLRAG